MLSILQDTAFQDHQTRGFLETHITLPKEIVQSTRAHYATRAFGHNDFPKFFVNNEHQSYLEGALLGFFLNAFPKQGLKLVKGFYAKAYSKAVYCDQVCMEPVLRYVMDSGFSRFFKTRYMVASYDMYLRNGHEAPAAGIHIDLPNFHHFYETENDLSLYIPLVDLNETNGGRITVLPEQKLRAPGNVLLKMLVDYFSNDPECLDDEGYIDPNRVGPEKIRAFVKTEPHEELMRLYKSVVGIAKKHYASQFRATEESAGKIVVFNNKNFHAAEKWKNQTMDREVYVIRMFPLYDVKIRLKKTLHGTPINNFLLDMKENTVKRFDDEVDVRRIPSCDKVAL